MIDGEVAGSFSDDAGSIPSMVYSRQRMCTMRPLFATYFLAGGGARSASIPPHTSDIRRFSLRREGPRRYSCEVSGYGPLLSHHVALDMQYSLII